MQELFVVLFIALVAVGAHFAFKKPKKANPWSGRSSASNENEGEKSSSSSFSSDFTPTPVSMVSDEEIAPTPRVKKTTNSRKKYGGKISKTKK